MDYRPVPTGDAQRKSPRDMGISSLHLQFAERFPPLYRGGTLRAQATSVNSEMAHRIEQLNQFVSGLRMDCGSARAKIFSKHTVCFLSWDTRVLFFQSRKFFHRN